jgi:exodeoxyribonuclease-3
MFYHFKYIIKGGNTLRFISWNIDSLNAALTSDSARALLSRKVLDRIIEHNPEIIALQETKLTSNGPTKKHMEILKEKFSDYEIVWNSSVEPARKSYAGTMFLYKNHLKPSPSFPVIGAPSTMDAEGRIITLEFDNFYLTQVYTPNAGDGLKRLEERQIWDEKYADYLADLDKEKYVIASGDFNVAHKEIDLAHPDNNRRSAGFTDEERQGFTNLLGRGFTDTFRYIHGDVKDIYTWWAQRVKTSKINNSGWRIDYWLVSDRIADKVLKSEIVDSGPRQDHTPILLEIDL